MKAEQPMLCRWMGAAVSTVGRGHIEKGKPCQDAASVSLEGDVAAIVISDGAGSAQHSEHGAAIAVKTATQILRETVPWTAPEALKEQVLTMCRAEMTKRAQELGCPLGELAATLAFVAATRDVCIAGNLGDGIVAALRNDTSEVLIGQERGEFANETVFLTSSRANAHLRVIKKPADAYDGFAVMSDGAAESLYQRHKDVLAPALIRLFSWFEENTSTSIRDALQKSVMPLLTERTPDDCSLAVLRRVRVTVSALSEKTAPFQMEITGSKNTRGLRNRLKVLECCQKGMQTPHAISEATDLAEGTVRRHRRALESILDQS